MANGDLEYIMGIAAGFAVGSAISYTALKGIIGPRWSAILIGLSGFGLIYYLISKGIIGGISKGEVITYAG